MQAKHDPTGTTSSIASAATVEIVTSVAKSMRLKWREPHLRKSWPVPTDQGESYTAMGWKDRYVMQGCATLGDRLWR
jgi:hypothetical protein